VEVRLATLDDIEAMCPLLTEFFAYNAQLHPAYCSADIERGVYPKIIIESDSADFFIAVEGNTVVGCLHIDQKKTPPYTSVVPHNYAEIISFAVAASHRERGIGAMLIKAAKQWGRARSLDYIELTSLRGAEEANRFYDNKDFTVVSCIRRYTL